ncbi:MAG: disulfide bond formation protein DsbB [Planctomycetota bacterium]|jgi:disulfide bond formation protein DsbB
MYTFTSILTIVTVATQTAIIALLIIRFVLHEEHPLRAWITRNWLTVASIVALGAVASPLVYSEIFQLTPCKLCWFNRIIMFPSAYLLLLATWWKDIDIIRYLRPLMITGGALSIFHYTLQRGINTIATDCAVVGQTGGGCGDVYILELGYITIPLMALTAYGLIFVLTLYAKNRK